MAKTKQLKSQEKFKTMIGGQALIEGIMMRGPDKDAVVVRGKEGLTVEVTPRKLPPEHSPLRWPLIRGIYNFFGSNIVGVKALMRSADLSPEEGETEAPSKFDQWLEKKLGNEGFQKALVGFAVVLGLGMSVGLFFLLPMVIGGLFDRWITSNLGINLLEGVIRMGIFFLYMYLISRMKDMRRLFSYHGAEHKTIRCYEAKLPLTVENVRRQTRLHPRCGTSFLLVVMVLSILIFSIASSALLALAPGLEALRGSFLFRLVMIVYKLLLLPLVVSVAYEINRWVGRYDNLLTRIVTAPGMWFQNFTTNEPDDSMIEVGIAALEAVLPEKEGADQW
ncbi:MAG: DUF1385 domain-containing protein [Oscillospiraceae bacterium]|jgi:uncharacterized protein YqhQ|nr:MAG: hypothetical protein BHW33_04925 [Firmicutes bacterium CAG:137_57_8]CDB31100.1 putative uncharacterized protein [Firmicutes bacterium CAG:137]